MSRACPQCGAQVTGTRAFCDTCGAPLPRVEAVNARMGLTAVAVAVAAVVIAAAVVLSGTRPPSGAPGPPQPIVSLSGFTLGDSSSSVQVVNASVPMSPVYFRVGLTINGTATTMLAMPTYGGGSIQFTTTTGMSSMTFAVQWADQGTTGSLDTGDLFYVNRSSSTMGCVAIIMDFRLGWWNGSMVAHAPYNWSCTPPLKPVVTFSAVTVSSGYATMTVAGASRAVSIASYQFNLAWNGTFGPQKILVAGNQTLSVGTATFYLVFTDVSGNGMLVAGDIIRIGLVGGPLPSGSYSFYLIWGFDGSIIATVNWTV